MSAGRTWRGRPVPWVTLWSGERVDHEPSLVIGRDRVFYRHDPGGIDRDRFGVLWARFAIAPGEGEPVFSAMHTGRQREAARRLRCQICGVKVDPQRAPWLLPAQEHADVTAKGVPMTATPPCCETCWPVAEAMCPHLRGSGVVRAYLAGVRRAGVYGDGYVPGCRVGEPVDIGFCPDGDPGIAFVLARQLVVTWDAMEHAGETH